MSDQHTAERLWCVVPGICYCWNLAKEARDENDCILSKKVTNAKGETMLDKNTIARFPILDQLVHMSLCLSR